jgi:hypothetical protein
MQRRSEQSPRRLHRQTTSRLSLQDWRFASRAFLSARLRRGAAQRSNEVPGASPRDSLSPQLYKKGSECPRPAPRASAQSRASRNREEPMTEAWQGQQSRSSVPTATLSVQNTQPQCRPPARCCRRQSKVVQTLCVSWPRQDSRIPLLNQPHGALMTVNSTAPRVNLCVGSPASVPSQPKIRVVPNRPQAR